MTLLVQQLLPIVLAVYIEQLPAQLPQLGDRDKPAIEPTDIFSVRLDLPLNEEIPLLVRPADFAPVRIRSRLVRSPIMAPMASTTMDFPAPVSPVKALKPLSN